MKKWFWLIVLLAGVVLPVHAQESIPISSPEDLAAIAENPGGDYILTVSYTHLRAHET